MTTQEESKPKEDRMRIVMWAVIASEIPVMAIAGYLIAKQLGGTDLISIAIGLALGLFFGLSIYVWMRILQARKSGVGKR
ncbi:MAG: hypothetical protein ACFE7E_03220 [Candidatus Hodarchaeota archaeon]